MGMDRIIQGHFTELVVGSSTFHYETDMEALEMAEKLPDIVRWKVHLQHDRGTIESEKYRESIERVR